MQEQNLSFVIPTYRLREVGETVAQYDEHFWRNGHSVPILVFDDSSRANHEKYYAMLEQTPTHNEILYVGPHEKEQFISYLNQRLPDKRLQGLVKSLFRPSYGGNRNYTLVYTRRCGPEPLPQQLHAQPARRRDPERGNRQSPEEEVQDVESDFFQHNLLRIVDDVVSVIKGSLELWPTLIEICYFQKGRKGLPLRRLTNPRK